MKFSLRDHLPRAAALALLLAAAAPLSAQQLRVFSPDELREVGQASLARRVAEHGRDENPRWRRDVGMVIDSVNRAVGYRSHPLIWDIIADSALNASAAPGGVMIVNVGLPLFCEEFGRQRSPSDAARARRVYLGCLAAVIGHGFAHLALGHSDSLATMIQRRQDIARRSDRAPSVLAAIRDSVLMAGLRHERRQELDADRAGALYILRAGWEIQDAIDLFTAMDSVSRRGAGWRGNISWLGGHPPSSERAALLESSRAQLKLLQRDFDDAVALIDHDIMPDSAMALLDRVLAAFPNLPAARHAKAVLLGRRWIAGAQVSELKVRPSMPAYGASFMSAIRGGVARDLAAARTAFREAVRLNGHPYSLSNLAVLDAYAGDAATARQRAEEAVERMPNDAEVQNNLGVVHYLAGRYAEAHRAFARAEQLAGRALTPAIAFNVARAAAAAGDTTNALRLLARYAAFDSRSGWGREAVALQRQLGGPGVAQQSDPAPAAGAGAAPAIAGITLGNSRTQVRRVLGAPDASADNPNGVVWRYAERGLLVLVHPTEGVLAIVLEKPGSGAVGGVSVGDRAAEALPKLGAPAERERRGTAELLAYDRGSWAIVVMVNGGTVEALSIRSM